MHSDAFRCIRLHCQIAGLECIGGCTYGMVTHRSTGYVGSVPKHGWWYIFGGSSEVVSGFHHPLHGRTPANSPDTAWLLWGIRYSPCDYMLLIVTDLMSWSPLVALLILLPWQKCSTIDGHILNTFGSGTGSKLALVCGARSIGFKQARFFFAFHDWFDMSIGTQWLVVEAMLTIICAC